MKWSVSGELMKSAVYLIGWLSDNAVQETMKMFHN